MKEYLVQAVVRNNVRTIFYNYAPEEKSLWWDFKEGETSNTNNKKENQNNWESEKKLFEKLKVKNTAKLQK